MVLMALSLLSLFSRYSPAAVRLHEPHSIQVLEHGQASFLKRLQIIDKAKKTIDVEYFIYKADESGRLFTQALLKKAREGVKIRILIDKSPLAPPLNKYIAYLLKQEGVELRYYNPLTFLSMFIISHRTHRKMLVVDNREAVTGGRNIGLEYFEAGEGFNFLDRDIYLEGPLVRSMTESFEVFFHSKWSKRPGKVKEIVKRAIKKIKSRFSNHNDKRYARNVLKKLQQARQFLYQEDKKFRSFRQRIFDQGQIELDALPTFPCEDISFESDSPALGKRSRRFFKYFKQLLLDAQSDIILETPYFIMLGSDRKLMKELRKKGTQIKLISNTIHANNHPAVSDVFYWQLPWLRRHHIDVALLTGEAIVHPEFENPQYFKKIKWGLHAKSALIDGKISLFMTYNMDPQSQKRSAEMGIACHQGAALADHLKILLERHEEQSIPITNIKSSAQYRSLFYKASFWEKLAHILRVLPANIFSFML